MIGLDTNVLVRYLMQDDERQSRLATSLIESLHPANPGFIPIVTTLETSWVLARAYKLERADIARWLSLLLRSRELVIDRGEDVQRALHIYEAGAADFADCLVAAIAKRAGCSSVMSFDRKAVKTAGMTLLVD